MLVTIHSRSRLTAKGQHHPCCLLKQLLRFVADDADFTGPRENDANILLLQGTPESLGALL